MLQREVGGVVSSIFRDMDQAVAVHRASGTVKDWSLRRRHFWRIFSAPTCCSSQHFLGLDVDYPDAFAGWHFWSSIGSYIFAAAC
ncbi:hypothetical protein [Bosea sp. 2KB_26]|uniref:hypothetical protein n=1 Tax=Bosea sp. 2KB_26 TaxID=3237475 RepID=UPI003F8E7B81